MVLVSPQLLFIQRSLVTLGYSSTLLSFIENPLPFSPFTGSRKSAQVPPTFHFLCAEVIIYLCPFGLAHLQTTELCIFFSVLEARRQSLKCLGLQSPVSSPSWFSHGRGVTILLRWATNLIQLRFASRPNHFHKDLPLNTITFRCGVST